MSIANPTPTLSLERQIIGSNSNTWGDRENANWSRVDQTASTLIVDVTSGNATLTNVDSTDLAADAQTRFGVVVAGGSPSAAATVTWPAAVRRSYVLVNTTTQTVTFKVSGQSGIAVPAGRSFSAIGTDVDLVAVDSRANINTGYVVFSASGTFLVPIGVTKLKVIVVGAGGGGSGSPVSGTAWSGSGGGGGGWSEGVFSVTPGTVYAVTVGTAGGFGNAASNGGAGGSSSFGSLITATGGTGGVANGGGGLAGIGAGGQINGGGSGGGDGYIAGGSGLYVSTGCGGGSRYGGGGPAGAGHGPGQDGKAPGAGGGAAYLTNNIAGGNGAGGIVIVEF